MHETSTTVRCVIVGDGGIGKRFMVMDSEYGRGKPVTESKADLLQTTIQFGGEEYHLTIFQHPSTGKRAQKTRNEIYAQANVILVCFSTHDRSSFKNVLAKWMPEVLQGTPSPSIVLVGMSECSSSTEALQRFLPRRPNTRFSESQSPIAFDRCVQLATHIRAKAYLECDGLKKKMIENVFEEAILATLGPQRLKPRLKLLNCCIS